jgi:dienelactone hydrolase
MVEGGVCMGCVTGAIHDGSPKGKVDQVADLPAYIAEPPSNTDKTPGIIVIVPDIFGWDFINSRLLADDYAEKTGKTVYLPDFMFGGVSHICD